jgi:hypothetical protein
MEEIITVDGRQFKLSTDRPLTAEQKTQTIAEIRKQTGCGTCGKPATAGRTPNIRNMGNRAGIATLQDCQKATVSGNPPDDIVTLAASPDEGTAPYNVRFLIQVGGLNAGAPRLLSLGDGALSGDDEQTVDVDGGTTTAVTYTVNDTEIVGSGTAPPAVADVDTSGIPVPLGSANSMRFIVHTTDSCPTANQHCIEYCDLTVECPTPSCNFVVS